MDLLYRFLSGLLAMFLSVSTPAETPAGAETAGKRGVSRCLVIGYERFVSMPDIAPCSANNAAAMTALFADFVPDMEAIVRRVNGPGTVAGLEYLIRNTFRESAPEDTCWLYISTHGVAWKEEGETRLALMLSDGKKEEALDPAVLREMLDGIPGKKVLIFDACHSGALLSVFEGPGDRVLTSSDAEEDSYFWRTGPAEDTGEGYFTAALESALRASRTEQIDPDGDGSVSMREILDRLSRLYGASSARGRAENDGQPMFRLPEKRDVGERVRGLVFEQAKPEDGALILPLFFTVEEATRVEYRIVLKRNGAWDLEHSSARPDQERTGTTRGLLSPGEKQRKIRISADKLGGEGMALLMVVSLRGIHGQVPVLEGTAVISVARE